MSDVASDDSRAAEFHTRLDRGIWQWVLAILLSAGYAGAWYWARTHGVPSADRGFGAFLPVMLAFVGLVVSFRREMHAGPYGIVITTWPVALSELRLPRPEVLVVAVAKRTRRRRELWDVVAQTRHHGYRHLTLPFADNDDADGAAAAIRAALDRK